MLFRCCGGRLSKPKSFLFTVFGREAQILCLDRFRTQRVTLKITPPLSSPGHAVSLLRRALFEAKILSFYSFWTQSPNSLFLQVPDATFDIEDHTIAGPKTAFLSSPGHAVSLLRRAPFEAKILSFYNFWT